MDIKKTYWAIALAIAILWAVFSALPGIVIGLSRLGLLELLPAPSIIVATIIGSGISGRFAEKLLP
jgi:MFS superfamily sulfate permease-like transporter